MLVVDNRLNNLRRESARLKTFDQSAWPQTCPIRIDDLAREGFHYIGPNDRVQCIYCRGILKDWSPGDTVHGEHKRFFPRCPFLRKRDVGNISLEDENKVYPKPKHPDYAKKENRMKSFEGWTGKSEYEIDNFVDSGFFYTGIMDQLTCFSCGTSLRNWQCNDDPWIEHAKWSPECPYLLAKKGDDFVQDIYSQMNLPSPTDERHSLPSPEVCKNPQGKEFIPNLHIVPTPATEEFQPSTYFISHPEPATTVIKETPFNTGSREYQERLQCKICMDNVVEVTFIPCGHLVCCLDCLPMVSECPICRREIKGTVRTYLA